MKKYIFISAILLSAYLYGSGIIVPGSSAGGAWGTITGTLSNQTDLQTALDARVADTGNETIAGIKTFSSAPIVSALTAQAMPYLNASKVLSNGGWTQADTTFATTFTPAGSPTDALTVEFSGITGFTNAMHITGNFPDSNARALAITGVTQGTDRFHYAQRTSITGTATTGTTIPLFATATVTNTGNVIGGYNATPKGAYGVLSQCYNDGVGGSCQSIVGVSTRAKTNIGGLFHSINAASVASNKTIGVHALATQENSAQANAVYGKLNSVSGSAEEAAVPATAAAGYFDNGDTTAAALIAADAGTTVFQVKDGGNSVMKAMAVTPTTVDVTADNQSLTVTNASHIRLTSDNSTATNRTFVLGDGGDDGQTLTLEWNEDNTTGAGEMADSGNQNLSAIWSPNIGDVIHLSWNSAASEWREVSRSDN